MFDFPTAEEFRSVEYSLAGEMRNLHGEMLEARNKGENAVRYGHASLECVEKVTEILVEKGYFVTSESKTDSFANINIAWRKSDPFTLVW